MMLYAAFFSRKMQGTHGSCPLILVKGSPPLVLKQGGHPQAS